MKNVLKTILSVILVAIMLVSMGFSSVSVKSMKLDKTKISINVGETVKLKVILSPNNATNKRLIYSTKDSKIATVDGNGFVRGIKAGNTVITVTSMSNNKISVKCNISITEVKLPKLKFLNRDAAFDITKDPSLALFKSITGYDVKYEALPPGDAGTNKLMILMASGEQYDLLTIVPPHFDKLLGSKAIMEIGGLLDKYGDEIKKQIPDKLVWQRTSMNDKIYGIPQISTGDGPQSNTIVRVDVLQKLGLKMPITANEFYNVVKTIKEKIPEMIPYTLEGESGGYTIPNIMSAFGLPNLPWIDINGTLVPLHKAPRYKEYFTFVAKLYTEGLMDKDMPALKQSQKQEKYTSGKAAMAKIIWQEGMTIGPAIKKNLPESQSEAMPFLKGNDGKQIVDVQTGVAIVAAIPKHSRNAEHVIKLINKFLNKDKFLEFVLGKEGESFEIKDGDYYPLQPKFNDEKANGWWYAPTFSAIYYPTYWEARVRRNADLLEWYTKTQKAYKTVPNKVVKLDAFAPPIESFSKFSLLAGNTLRDDFNKIVYGALPMTEFDKAIEKWEKAGGDEMVADINKWYKEIKK